MASNTRPVYGRPSTAYSPAGIVTADDLLRAACVGTQPYKLINWRGLKICVKHSISAREYMEAVQNVLDICRTPEDGIAIELLDCAIKAVVIGTFASVSIPNDFGNIFHIVYDSDLYDVVYEAANKKLIEAIIQSVKLCIDAG